MRVEPDILKFLKENKVDRGKIFSKEIRKLKKLPLNKLEEKIQKKLSKRRRKK